jgi:hypothetical protein
MFKPQVTIPLDDYNLVKPLLKRQQQARIPKPQPLTPSQLNQQLVAAHQEKLRRLAIALQNRKIWAQSELVSKNDKREASKIGGPEMPIINLDNWLDHDGRIKFRSSK